MKTTNETIETLRIREDAALKAYKRELARLAYRAHAQEQLRAAWWAAKEATAAALGAW